MGHVQRERAKGDSMDRWLAASADMKKEVEMRKEPGRGTEEFVNDRDGGIS